jgi:replicative DNA helicase
MADPAAKASRLPPHNQEAEEALIGAMLLSRDAISEAVEVVAAEDFFQPSLQRVFSALQSLYASGLPTDVVSVTDELKRMGALDLVGGTERLLVLQSNTPAIASAVRYAEIVRDYSLLRRLIKAATEIAEAAYELPSDVHALIDAAEAKVFEVAKGTRDEQAASIKDILWDTLEELEKLYPDGGGLESTVVSSGFTSLDEKLMGLHKSNLVIVGARPGMGKTSFALSMASKVAQTTPDPVLVFSLEMSRYEIGQRLLAAEARVDSVKIRSGKLAEKEWDKLSHAAGRLAERPIYIDDSPNLTVLDVRARSRRLKAMQGLSLVVVDYLQLMSSRRNVESRQVEVSEISRGLKLLARELDVPVVALSQLSRNLENRSDKRPQLADLRESGCLTWDTRVHLSGGEEVALGWLWATGQEGFEVLSLSDTGELVVRTAKRVVATGVKPVFRYEMINGAVLNATSSHKVLTKQGFVPIGELGIGDEIVFLASGLAGDPRSRRLEKVAISSCSEVGYELVFDLEVADTHNFVANGLLVHNSLEQDADIVLFIYRDELYNPDTPDRGVAEIIVAKHRNGPTGVVHLAFMEHWALFADIART